MNDPVTVGIPLEGFDAEARAINAAVSLLETIHFHPLFPTDSRLTPVQLERISKYLADRYSLGKSAAPSNEEK